MEELNSMEKVVAEMNAIIEYIKSKAFRNAQLQDRTAADTLSKRFIAVEKAVAVFAVGEENLGLYNQFTKVKNAFNMRLRKLHDTTKDNILAALDTIEGYATI